MGKPKIRFEGYREDWEQRKLGDITTKIGSGKTPKGGAAAYKDDGIALIRSQNVNGDRVDLSDVVFIDEQTDEDMKNSRVLKGDVLLNITGASIGRSAVFTRELRANVNQHVCIIRTKGSDASPEFIQLNIISSNGQNQIDSFQAGGGREGLNFHQIGKMEFLYPGIEEQQKIGQYFANLDHLITLHQRKCDEIKTLKKYMLQKMFSQNGEKVPEIRFNGFTEDWEQRKLGDITTKIGSGKTPKGGAAAYKDDGIALIRSQNVNGDRVDLSDVVFIDEQTDEDMKNSRVLKGDVLLNITGASIGRSAVFTRELRANVNQHVCIIRTKGSDASPEFIQLNIISSNGQNQIDSFQAGGGREGLNFHQIGKMEFLYPGIEEQQKIGQYFANLDHLITLHQRKCNELKEIKKYMLQNMFV